MVSTGNRASPFHSWLVLLKIGGVLFKAVVPVLEGFEQAVRNFSFQVRQIPKAIQLVTDDPLDSSSPFSGNVKPERETVSPFGRCLDIGGLCAMPGTRTNFRRRRRGGLYLYTRVP
jgi:hypothetical protein